MSSGGDGFVLASADGSSCCATLTSFAGFGRVGGSCDDLWLAGAGVGPVAVPVVSLGNDRDGGCDAVAEVGDCTRGVGASGASLSG